MATPRIAPDIKTTRAYVRFWLDMDCKPGTLNERALKRYDRLVTSLSHWYDDDLDDWDCECDACTWWKEQIHQSRRARK